MKILVTGGKGQLGREINKISCNYNYDWLFTDSNIFDLSDLKNINFFLSNYNPDIIINCAAYTAVDGAENDFKLANTINNKSVELIAKWCNVNKCKLIHISTDYVFDGESNIPYIESDLTNPLNNYGKSKLLGDLACLKNNPSSIILRTAWLYSSFGNNFVKKIINFLHHNDEIKVVNDQFGSPTYAGDLSEVILEIINTNIWKPGIYNYTNFGNFSWFDFANDIKSIFGFDVPIVAVSTSEYLQKAKRPKHSLLDNTKIINTFKIKQINYKVSLKKCIKILKNES